MAAFMVGCVVTGCKKSNDEGGKSDGKGNAVTGGAVSGTAVNVDINQLYEPSEYENLDYSKYLKLGDYSTIMKITDSDYTVNDSEVQSEIDHYCETYGTYEQIKDRKVKSGDTVNIDYKGKIDGKEFDGGSAEGYSLEIGSKAFIDGFEDGLIGAEPGKKVTLDLKFPEKYEQNTEVQGKAVKFEVTVNYINGKLTPAEFTDDLANQITNGDYKTADEFKTYLKDYLESQKRQQLLSNFKSKLLEITEFTGDYSEFTNKEYQAGVDYYTQYSKDAGYSMDDFAKSAGYENEQGLLDYIKTDSEKYVKEKLALYAFGKDINVSLQKDDYTKGAEKIVRLYGYGSIESLITQYSTSVVRFDIYGDHLVDEIAKMYHSNESASGGAESVSPSAATAE